MLYIKGMFVNKHKFMRTKLSLVVAGVLAAGMAPVAMADSNDQQIEQMQQEIRMLEQRLEQIQNQTAQTAAKVDSVAPSKDGSFKVSGVNVKFGGFLANETVYRGSSLQSDIGSPFSHIAFAPAPGTGSTAINEGGYYNQSEFRDSARQSRFTLLAQGNVNPSTVVSGYYELDFLGAGGTANSNESNSYNPRTRHVYATIDWLDSGWHLLAGQTWSLATLNSQGITPRNEVTPLTIDAQYVPGFVWARQPQLRVTKDWDKKFWAAVSLENAQTSGVAGTTNMYNIYSLAPIGGGLLNGAGSATANYSVNKYPDVVVKLAAETGIGHFEIFDLARNFESVYGASSTAVGNQQNTWTNAVGGGAIIPLMPKQLELNLSGLYGDGVGRYGTSSLPDASYNSDGSLAPLKGLSVLGGLIWHTTPKLDLYVNAGQDQVDSHVYAITASGKQTVYGYGNNVSGISVAAPQVAKVAQETIGLWWSAYKGSFGAAKLGLQYSHTNLTSFQVAGATQSTSDNMVLTSMRYYPF